MNGALSHLPWGWFLGLAVVDVGIARFAIRRRRADRRLDLEWKQLEAAVLVRCHGWLVARSRAARVEEDAAAGAWQWPVHREVLRRSAYNLSDADVALFFEEMVAVADPPVAEADALSVSVVGRRARSARTVNATGRKPRAARSADAAHPAATRRGSRAA